MRTAFLFLKYTSLYFSRDDNIFLITLAAQSPQQAQIACWDPDTRRGWGTPIFVVQTFGQSHVSETRHGAPRWLGRPGDQG
jgi:hypothetical protein